jgi:hypothetical protein
MIHGRELGSADAEDITALPASAGEGKRVLGDSAESAGI